MTDATLTHSRATHGRPPESTIDTAAFPQHAGYDYSFTLQMIVELQKTTAQLTASVETLKDSTEKQIESYKESTEKQIESYRESTAKQLESYKESTETRLGAFERSIEGRIESLKESFATKEDLANWARDIQEKTVASERDLRQTIMDAIKEIDQKRSAHYRWLIGILSGLLGSALVAGAILATSS